MSCTAKELLIIYQSEAEQWATYLKSVFAGPISDAGICCYDIATTSSRRDDFPVLARYNCKLLILSTGMLEGLCQVWRFFLSRVLSPAAHVVVLLCGVESLTPLLELVPLNVDECLQVSSEQEAQEYLHTVIDIVRKGVSATAANVNPLTCEPSGSEQKGERLQTAGVHSDGCRVVPARVPCGASTEVFILLRNEAPGGDTEVEFTGENQMLRAEHVRWNDRTLCVNAPDFPAGNVTVTVYSNGVPLSKAQLEYYSSMEEVACLLSRVADPVQFMCQALQVSSVDTLDDKLSSMLLEGMPSGGFPALQCDNTADRESRNADVPTLLHFAAQHGFKSVSSLLLQCPGAERALHAANRHGQTPVEIAKTHGHKELHVLLKETLNIFSPGEDSCDVYEVMCTAGNPSTADLQKVQRGEDEGEEEEEELYSPLGWNDVYDTILNPMKAKVIANRPPAPTPRPEGTQGTTPYITQVFQKKKNPQSNANLYSLPTNQADVFTQSSPIVSAAPGREDSALSTYETFVPNQFDGLQWLFELQQRVKAGSVTVDEALERFGEWQRVQKGMDAAQKEKLDQLRASIIDSRVDDNGVYDEINIVNRTSGVTVNKRRGQTLESDFHSKPQSHFFWRANKR